jgi:hypothetical protein
MDGREMCDFVAEMAFTGSFRWREGTRRREECAHNRRGDRVPKSDESSFPVRGVPGGWRDPWDDDDAAELRAASEGAGQEIEEHVVTIAPAWRDEIK